MRKCFIPLDHCNIQIKVRNLRVTIEEHLRHLPNCDLVHFRLTVAVVVDSSRIHWSSDAMAIKPVELRYVVVDRNLFPRCISRVWELRSTVFETFWSIVVVRCCSHFVVVTSHPLTSMLSLFPCPVCALRVNFQLRSRWKPYFVYYSMRAFVIFQFQFNSSCST